MVDYIDYRNFPFPTQGCNKVKVKFFLDIPWRHRGVVVV